MVIIVKTLEELISQDWEGEAEQLANLAETEMDEHTKLRSDIWEIICSHLNPHYKLQAIERLIQDV